MAENINIVVPRLYAVLEEDEREVHDHPYSDGRVRDMGIDEPWTGMVGHHTVTAGC